MHQLPCHAQPRLPINPNQIPPANLAMLELLDTTAVKVFRWFLSNSLFFIKRQWKSKPQFWKALKIGQRGKYKKPKKLILNDLAKNLNSKSVRQKSKNLIRAKNVCNLLAFWLGPIRWIERSFNGFEFQFSSVQYIYLDSNYRTRCTF